MTCVSSGTISLAGRHARPDAEIERVAPDHPAQEQVQPLAAAAGRRPRKEVADARPLAARGRRRALRSSASARVEKLSSAPSMSSAPPDRSLRGRTLRSIPARSSICRISHSSATRSAPRVQRWTMPANAGAVAARIEAPDVGGRRGAHRPPAPLDRLQHARHAAERQRRRAEPDDLAIVGALEPPDDLNRIGRRIGVVEARRTADRAPASAFNQLPLSSAIQRSAICNCTCDRL